jgi:hypothetical protein
VPLDKLFDQGFIGFANNGNMLVKDFLTNETLENFCLTKPNLRILKKISPKMVDYLTRHRELFGF